MKMVDAAVVVKQLRSTYASGITKDYDWRISQLKAFQKIVTSHEKEILYALRTDLSKPEHESQVQEIAQVLSACSLALKELKRWMKPQTVNPSIIAFPSSAKVIMEPLGVVLVISTWNFPFMLSLEPVIGAIAAGNVVVLKTSELAPATSALLAKLIPEYVDSSAVKVVQGSVPETTALLEQKWDKIFYTGSSRVGRIVSAAAAKHLTPVVLELGGKCPAVIDENINLTVAARRIISGKWGCNNGQACISPDYLITTKAYASKVAEAISTELDKLYGKDPLQSHELSRIINIHHFHRLLKLMDDDKVNQKIFRGGQHNESILKIAPTILLDVPQDALILEEEIFGPLLPIVMVDNIEDSIALISAKEKPLAAYLFTNNERMKDMFKRSISAGSICINDTIIHFLVPNLPFGGVGESGTGAYHGKLTFESFSHKKAVLERSFILDLDARYPPYAPWKTKFLKAVVQGHIASIARSFLCR